MKKGDLVLVPFPFTDLSGSKNRPALVLASNELDVLVAFLTTQSKWSTSYSIEIIPTSENGLKTDSLLRLDKITTIQRDLILGKIGEIQKSKLQEVNKILKILLELN